MWIHAESIRMALSTAAFDALVATLDEVAAADEGRDRADRFVFRLFE